MNILHVIAIIVCIGIGALLWNTSVDYCQTKFDVIRLLSVPLSYSYEPLSTDLMEREYIDRLMKLSGNVGPVDGSVRTTSSQKLDDTLCKLIDDQWLQSVEFYLFKPEDVDELYKTATSNSPQLDRLESMLDLPGLVTLLKEALAENRAFSLSSKATMGRNIIPKASALVALYQLSKGRTTDSLETVKKARDYLVSLRNSENTYMYIIHSSTVSQLALALTSALKNHNADKDYVRSLGRHILSVPELSAVWLLDRVAETSEKKLPDLQQRYPLGWQFIEESYSVDLVSLVHTSHQKLRKALRLPVFQQKAASEKVLDALFDKNRPGYEYYEKIVFPELYWPKVVERNSTADTRMMAAAAACMVRLYCLTNNRFPKDLSETELYDRFSDYKECLTLKMPQGKNPAAIEYKSSGGTTSIFLPSVP